MENERVVEFKDELDKLKIKSGSSDREKLYQFFGGALMIAGIGLTFIAYFVAGSQDSGDLVIDDLEHNEHIVLAIAGIAVTIVGAAIFLRYSLTRFFRFWLLRQIYENK
tara:strand:- start:473 stop:799 length:327 start_codon:yes stop_codon:yes gene_type:complete